MGFVAYLFVSVNNRLMALDTRCDTAFSAVRGFAGHERDILSKVTPARSEAMSASAPDSKLDSENVLSKTIVSLMVVAELYPDLKASSHFAELSAELAGAENRITASHQFYNLITINGYNAILRQFPGSFVGRFKKLVTRRPFDLGIERALSDEAVAFKF